MKNQRRKHKAEEMIGKPGKSKQQKEGEARKIIGEGQNMTNVQEETQNERAKQLQEEAELTILEDTDNWIACDKCKNGGNRTGWERIK